MNKQLKSPKEMESVFHHPDGINLPSHSKHESKSFFKQAALKEKSGRVESSENYQCSDRSVKRRFGLNLVLTAVSHMIKSIIGAKKYENRFFHVEEQRKFELEHQLKKHWPLELLHSSYIQRRDL